MRERDYRHGKGSNRVTFAVSGVTPLLVNLESMTAEPRADEGSKKRVPWEVEKAVCYFLHTDKINTVAADGDLPHMARSATLSQTALQVFERFFSAWESRERKGGERSVLHIQDAGE